MEEQGEKKYGGAGFRSLCLPIANRPLYRVSYTPRQSTWSYGVVVSISGCDPLDPGSTPGTAIFLLIGFRGSIVVSIPACHAGNPGSIPGLGVFVVLSKKK
jgi:hypothetical protein